MNTSKRDLIIRWPCRDRLHGNSAIVRAINKEGPFATQVVSFNRLFYWLCNAGTVNICCLVIYLIRIDVHIF